ncbi:hypothetical protein D3C80_1795120 [compost metagenome]
MNKAVFTRQNFYKCSEFLNPFHSTCINFTYNHFFNDTFNNGTGFIVHLLVRRSDKYASILLDIDLHTGLFNNFVDDFATGTNNITDLVRIDVHSQDLRSILR